MSSTGAYTTVVTGASGFVAGQIIKQLLEKGYNVRGTVRSLKNQEKVSHLEKLSASLPGTLKLYEADLLTEGSFNEVIDGADYVIHTASPFFNEADDPQKELIEPALKGTKNVLGSVAKNKKTVKRVVVTSSFAAVCDPKSGPSSPPRYTEKDWNNDSTVDNSPYMASKTQAERAAREIAKKEGFEIATINPTLVIGPVLSARKDATSIKTMSGILEGESNEIITWLCDVRDVARAHILALENPQAKGGRFIISQPDTVPNKHVTDVLKARFPDFKIMDGKDSAPEPLVDVTNALEVLGLGQLHPVETSIIDMATTLIQRGVAKPKTA